MLIADKKRRHSPTRLIGLSLIPNVKNSIKISPPPQKKREKYSKSCRKIKQKPETKSLTDGSPEEIKEGQGAGGGAGAELGTGLRAAGQGGKF
jgi:hypothetical protein